MTQTYATYLNDFTLLFFVPLLTLTLKFRMRFITKTKFEDSARFVFEQIMGENRQPSTCQVKSDSFEKAVHPTMWYIITDKNKKKNKLFFQPGLAIPFSTQHSSANVKRSMT